MATATGRARCVICEKERSAVRCEGCLQMFCRIHLNDHHQQLNQQLDEIQMNRDVFRQTFNEQMNQPQKHFLIKQIDKWEVESIERIRQTAKECKETVLQQTNEYFHQVEITLTKLTDQIREIRQENDFNEIDLNQLREKLIQLEKKLDQIPNVSIKEDSTSFIKKISVIVSSTPTIPSSPPVSTNTIWKQHGVTIAGGNGKGDQLNQLYAPYGIYVDDDHQCIYIADCCNNRIVEWKFGAKVGRVVAGGNGYGDRMNQLSLPTDVIVDKTTDSLIICDGGNRRVVRWPRQNGTQGETIISDIHCNGLTMDHDGDLYVSEQQKHQVRRWKIGEKNGTTVAGGNGRGDQLNQLNNPNYLFVDIDYCVYVSDGSNRRVMKWMKGAKEGIIVAGGQGEGDSLTQLSYPDGVHVDPLGHVYVADSSNHRIMHWSKRSKEGRVIVGGNGKGQQPDQFRCPRGPAFDREGNLYVVDFHNYRVQKFEIALN